MPEDGADGTNLPALRAPLPELCPPRDVLVEYARGGRDPRVAGHVSRCERCAWTVSVAMLSDASAVEAELIDVTPKPTWWERIKRILRSPLR